MTLSWEEDFDNENSESGLSSESSKFVAFTTGTNSSFVQGSSDRGSKSDEESNLHDFSDNEQDIEVAYIKLLNDSIHLSHINDKISHKLKASESHCSIVSSDLDDARVKVSQLESQRAILSENLITAEKEKELAILQSKKKSSKNWR